MNYRSTYQNYLKRWILKVSVVATAFLFMFGSNIQAEGSKDFLSNDGYRLFFWAEKQQQIKVYANSGEFINVGSSHVGLSGGFIRVFRPDGTLHVTYDNSDGSGIAIINNDIEELNGPTGGGSTAGAGYVPGVVAVGAGQEGIWTVTFEYGTYTGGAFANLLNNSPWTRAANQPGNRRVVLAWDVTVTQGGAGNNGGAAKEGRVYSNDYHSIMNRNGVTSSPVYYVLTKAGFQYEVKFDNVDPWGFPIYSNNIGLVDGNGNALYKSTGENDYIRSANMSNWDPNLTYLYEPQAEDSNGIINNKIFFNTPDVDMPAMAMTTDVWRTNTHTTWLFASPDDASVTFEGFHVEADNGTGVTCTPNSIQTDQGGYFVFELDETGDISLFLDMNNNGSYFDAVDINITKSVTAGLDSIFWDGMDGLGNSFPEGTQLTIPYKLSLRAGEIHVMLEDIENDNGGLTITLMNNVGVANPDEFYYNHTEIGGPLSGGGTGLPEPTNEGYVYTANFGNEKFLDYWAFVPFDGGLEETIGLNVTDDCAPPQQPDFDNDGIVDKDDIDDDNDGVPDLDEYCNPNANFGCLPGGWDPSGDEDGDAVPNMMDADDATVMLNCLDADGDGICDALISIFDTDGDGVPDHFDLDSDNDGITDLVEAGHMQPDANGDGIIDGPAALFGDNGLYNPIASDPHDLNATETYTIWDYDNDGIPDHDDLDSDNDGINDVAEAGYMTSDTNGDGRVDDGNGNVPTVSITGLVPLINPAMTGNPISLPPDWDGDSVPDWHDLDSDNDGINDVRETNKPDGDNDGFIGTGTPIVNVNGVATADANNTPLTTTSSPIDTDSDNTPDWHDIDSDNDGIFDTHEANRPDNDNNGVIGMGTPMVNSFGQPTADANNQPIGVISDPEDHDGDGIADFQDIDRDNDGIVDSYECEQWPCVDTDGDGISDVDDLDSDGDGLNDTDECINGANCPDDNSNNVDNFREYTCFDGNTPVIGNISADEEICEGQSVNLSAMNMVNATDSVMFAWAGPNGFMVTGTAPSAGPFPIDAAGLDENDTGNYSLTLTSDRGCPSQPEEVFILVNDSPDQPTIDANGNDFCTGEELILQTTVYNGTNVSYTWLYTDNGGNTTVLDTTTTPSYRIDFVRSVQSGIYQVAINNGVCVSLNSAGELVTITDNPVVDPPLNSTIDVPACEGDDIALEIAGVAGATYEWFGPNGFMSTSSSPAILNAEMSDAGQYYVVVTKDGCGSRSIETEVFVNETPDRPILSGPTDICEGSNAVLTIDNPVMNPTGPVRYVWFNAATGDVVGNSSSPTLVLNDIMAAASGSYIALAEMEGCASELSMPMTINVVPGLSVSAPTSNATQNNPICEGDDITLIVQNVPGATYEWYGPNGLISNTPDPVITNATMADMGSYYVIVTKDGCSLTTPMTDVFLLERADQPMLMNPGSVCEGGDVSLTVSNPPTQPGLSVIYEWYDANTNQLVRTTTVPEWSFTDVTNADEGDFYVVVVMNGCASEPSTIQSVVVGGGPALNAPTNTTSANDPVCSGDDILLSIDFIQNATYQWFGPNGFTSNVFNPMLTDLTMDDAGEYYVIVTANGCTTTTAATELFVAPTPANPIIAAPDTQCAGSDAEMNITSPTIPTGATATYEWFDANTNQLVGTTTTPTLEFNNATTDDAGTYYAIVTMDGCPSSQSNPQTLDIDVIPTEQAFGGTQMIFACTEEEIMLEAATPASPNVRGMWTAMGAAQVVQPQQNSTLVWDLAPGMNNFVWSLSAGACIDFDMDTVTVLNEGLVAATNDVYSLNDGETIESNMVVVNDNLNDVNDWMITVVTPPMLGTVEVNTDGTWTYTPQEGFFAEDMFVYEICNANCPEQCDEATVTVRSTSVGECFVPNFITPNNDGANDNFSIPCLDNPDAYPDNEMAIFNRWGDKVYDAAPYQNNWDGQWRNAPLPPGTYFYCMKLTPDSEAEMGYITVIR